MNLGLVTSFIIGGMLMLSIIFMNMNLSTSSADLTLTQINKQHVQTITDMLTYDIPKIGFGNDGKVTKYTNPATSNPYKMIEVADHDRLVFYSSIDYPDNTSIDKVTWHFDKTKPVTSTENPNDYVLVRTQNGVDTEITFGVTKFKINYYDEYGADKSDTLSTPVPDPSVIKQIDIELVIQSKEKIKYSVGSDGRYVTSAWEKRFTPRNLQ